MKKTIAIILSALLIIGTVSIAAVSAASGTKIVLNGTTYECGEGDTITYTINMTTPEVIENGQFIIYYPSSLLSVSDFKFDSILGAPLVNYTENVTDEIDFNFSKYEGYDFTTKHLLIEVSFIVKSAGSGEISLDRSASNLFICNLNDVNITNSVIFEEFLGNVTKIEDSTSTEPSSTDVTQPTTVKPKPAPKPSKVTATTKKSNPIKVTVKTKTVKKSKLKKAKQTVKAITVKKAKGTVSYKKVSGSKKLTISKKSGKITVRKGKYKKSTLKIKVKVTAKGTKTYKSKSITKTVKVKVK